MKACVATLKASAWGFGHLAFRGRPLAEETRSVVSKPRLAEALRDGAALLLRNHYTVGVSNPRMAEETRSIVSKPRLAESLRDGAALLLREPLHSQRLEPPDG